MQDKRNHQNDAFDNRNLIIFMLITAVLYFAYDTYIMGPHKQAMNAARQQAAQERAVKVAKVKAIEAQRAVEEEVAKPSYDPIFIGNDRVQGQISPLGGRLDQLDLLDYHNTLEQEELVRILSPKKSAHPRGVEYGWVSSSGGVALPNADTLWQVQGGVSSLTPDQPVTLFWDNGEGVRFERSYSLDQEYLITVEQRVINNSSDNLTLYPYGLIAQQGLPEGMAGRSISHDGGLAYVGEKLEKATYKNMQKKGSISFSSQQGWIGVTEKYWLVSLLPPQGQDVQYRFTHSGAKPLKNQKDMGSYQADFTGSALALAPGQSGSVSSHIFVGPKKAIMLKDYSESTGVEKLDLSVDFGMFWFFTIPFFYALHYLGEIFGNMGVAIIVLTIIIRTAVSPLTYSSYKSFAKMKKVMPQVNDLREKYGEDDKQKLQEEMLKLYQHEGVNPMAGCFPMILQIPVFFAFYKILFVTIEVRHAPFFGWIQDLSAADPTNVFNAFGLIPWDPPSILHVGVWPCLMLLGMWMQKSLNPPPVDKIQRDMTRIFPLVMTFVMAKFASGLVIYWTVSAYFGIVQQAVIMRKMGVPIHLFGESHDDEKSESSQQVEASDESSDGEDEPEPEVIENISAPKRKKKKKK